MDIQDRVRQIVDECQVLIGAIETAGGIDYYPQACELARRCTLLPPGPLAAVATYATLRVLARLSLTGDPTGTVPEPLSVLLGRCEDHAAGSQQPPIVEAAMTVIQRAASRPDCRLSAVAKRMHVSQFYLDRMLKKYTDLTFTQHVRRYRVQHAQHLLRGDLSIKEIAAAVGFRDASALDRAFRRAVGSRPTTYRKTMIGLHTPRRSTR